MTMRDFLTSNRLEVNFVHKYTCEYFHASTIPQSNEISMKPTKYSIRKLYVCIRKPLEKWAFVKKKNHREKKSLIFHQTFKCKFRVRSTFRYNNPYFPCFITSFLKTLRSYSLTVIYGLLKKINRILNLTNIQI